MNDVDSAMPMPSMNSHSSTASANAQMNEMTPWSMLGGRRCIGDDPIRAAGAATGPKKFAEPVTLSSVESTDLRLPPTAARLDFDLLALRARRKQQPSRSPGARQEGQ